jgi:hypothetical protein
MGGNAFKYGWNINKYIIIDIRNNNIKQFYNIFIVIKCIRNYNFTR